MNAKIFSERLHEALDQIDFPSRFDERVEAFAKLVKIPRFKAESLLDGSVYPDPALLSAIVTELEISETWLKGESSA